MESKDLVPYIDKTAETWATGTFDYVEDNPLLAHPKYKLVGAHGRVTRDYIRQRTLNLQFEIRLKEGIDPDLWDTAEALAYLARITFVLKSFNECARIAINYDTAHQSFSIKRHILLTVIYVVDLTLLESGKKNLLNNLQSTLLLN